MRILIVSRSFYPVLAPRAFRATELAREFTRQGHEVTVLLPDEGYDYTSFLNENPIILKSAGKLKYKDIQIKGGKAEQLVRRFLRRLMLFLEWPDIELVDLMSKALRNEGNYHLLISIAVPHPVHWAVAKVHKKNRIARIWIADCGDPYMLSKFDSFKKPFYFKYFEKAFCSRCDYISVPFEEMKNQFYEDFRNKIITIPQGFNFNDIKKYSGKIENAKPTFIFAGSIIPGIRDLTKFISFISSTEKDFLFIVYTKQISWFKQNASSLNGKLIVRDYIDRISLIYEMSKADFLVNIDTLHDNENNIQAIPSKLIDYALSGRPILNLRSDVLDKRAVLNFLEGNYESARKIDIGKYDIRKVTEQFLDKARFE